MNADWTPQVLAIVVKQLGGSVTINRKDLFEIGDTQLIMDQDILKNTITFYVEDDTVVQGELV